MNRLRGTFSVNRGPVWLRLGTCPPLSTVTLAAGRGPGRKAWYIPLPESGSQSQWGRGARNLGENLGPKARQAAQGPWCPAPPLPQTGPSAQLFPLSWDSLDQETLNLHKNALARFPTGSTHTANGQEPLGSAPQGGPKASSRQSLSCLWMARAEGNMPHLSCSVRGPKFVPQTRGAMAGGSSGPGSSPAGS